MGIVVNTPAPEVIQVTETSPGGTTAQGVGLQGLTGPDGPPGPQGAPGPQGPPGGAGSSYTHHQMIPATDWSITHNLGRIPAGLLVLDNATPPVEIIGEVTYVDLVDMTVHFYNPQVGTATVS